MHKLSCHTRLVLRIPRLCVGVNTHTLHTKIFIKEIQSKILKKHKLSCHTRVILLMPQPCAYNYQGLVFLADVYIFHASFFRSVVRSNLKFLMTLYHKYLKLILTKSILDTPAKPGSIIAIRFLRELSIYVYKDFVEICRYWYKVILHFTAGEKNFWSAGHPHSLPINDVWAIGKIF